MLFQKKGGNVKTIPPYKPIPNDNHSSDSSPEKDAEGATVNNKPVPQSSSSSSSGKRKSNSSNNKSSSSSSKSSTSANKSNISSSSSHQKTVHSSSSSNKVTSAVDKSSKNYSSSSSSVKGAVKNTESDSTNIVNAHQAEPEKTVEKNTSAHTNVSNKDNNSSAQKYPSANFGESVVTQGTDVVFGDNRSDSNLSSNSTKDNPKNSKKRKANSRTPTPNSITQPDTDRSGGVSTIVSVTQSVSATQNLTSTVTSGSNSDRRDSVGSVDSLEKPKKVFH